MVILFYGYNTSYIDSNTCYGFELTIPSRLMLRKLF